MADFKYTDQDPDWDLMASIAKLLDAHSIPNVVWDTYLLSAYGYNSPADANFSFVINDKNINKARDVLLAAGFRPCTRGDSCRSVFPLCYPTPYAHFYIGKEDENPNHWFPLRIHKKSHLLWAMPDIPLGAPAPGDPDYMSVSDDCLPESHPGLGTGRVASTHYPIKIPTPARYAEALLLLALRDAQPGRELQADHWRYDILEIADADILKLEDLTDPRIRRYYELSRDENIHYHNVCDYEEQLKVEMMEKKELPDTTFKTLTRGGNE